jgi:hypothetical protein
MLPDQVDNLFNFQFLITLILWPLLLIAALRAQATTLRRGITVILWLSATVFICPSVSTRLNTYHDTMTYMGIQSALDDQCGQGHAQAGSGKVSRMSSYHWRWDVLRGNHFVVCDYEPGYTSWECVC